MTLTNGRGRAIAKKLHSRDPACWLCRMTVKWELAATLHPGAPSLDHVVPLSKGGTSRQANLRLVHRYCNSVRGDAPDWAWTEHRREKLRMRFVAAVARFERRKAKLPPSEHLTRRPTFLDLLHR